jgi:predicted NBD/HSP70 family sugar kinase
MVDGNVDRVTTREVANAAESDPAIREAIENAATYIGIAAANVIATIREPTIAQPKSGDRVVTPISRCRGTSVL